MNISHQLDYLRFSFDLEQLQAVRDALPWDHSEECKGRWFQKQGARDQANGYMLLWNPHVVLDMPGSCCLLSDPDILKRFYKIESARVTRLDLAYDVRGEFASRFMEGVLEAVNLGQFYGCRQSKVIQGSKHGISATTVYLGARGKDGSGRYVRIYDKRAEQLQKRVLPDDQRDIPWVRFELELSDPVADSAAWFLACGRGIDVSCWLDFRLRQDPNRERNPRLDWWSEFLAMLPQGEPVRVDRKSSTLEGRLAWLAKCVAPFVVGNRVDLAKLLRETPTGDFIKALRRDFPEVLLPESKIPDFGG
ncbi:MAG: replication initiation factor domain-containing protein [Phycisphaeraceae bacterium]|nr:replication initiation factor domain-containing protein [Phycisphaeraceae bacterium]